MALPLSGASDAILDPAKGQADLENGLIRVLHERSFQDDATRIPRACRYAARFGFTIEAGNAIVGSSATCAISTAISGTRLREELSRTLAEDEPEEHPPQRSYLTACSADDPSKPAFRTPARGCMRRTETAQPERRLPAAYWPVFARGDSPADGSLALYDASLSRTLNAPRWNPCPTSGRSSQSWTALPSNAAPWSRRSRPSLCPRSGRPPPWRMTQRPENASLTTSRLPAIFDPSSAATTSSPWASPSGPQIGEILRRLRDAKLDGEVHTRADEERLVHNTSTSSIRYK